MLRPRYELEVKSKLRRKCAWRHVVRAAERGQEVVERVFVRHVDCRQLQTNFVSVSVKQIIVSKGEVEDTSRRDTLRVVVVILLEWCRYFQQC